MFFKKVFYNENNKPIEIDLICNKCNAVINVKDDIEKIFSKVENDYCLLKSGEIVKCTCGNYSDVELIERKRDVYIKTTNQTSKLNCTPRCIYCSSTNIRKISGLSKAGSVVLFGIFALGKVGKQWHCNSCNSDF